MFQRVPSNGGPAPIHLNPAAPVAARVLLPGDPHRALNVASELLDDVKILNQRRGLWGYTGTAPDGAAVTVQATGMGGPSAAIVAEELVGLGAEVLIRIGTCGALAQGLELGDLVAVEAAIAADGASGALGAGERVAADPGLAGALAEASGGPALTVVSSDLFYDPREGLAEAWVAAGAAAIEMEAAAIFQVAANRGLRAGCLLGVSDLLGGAERRRVSSEELETLGLRLGEVALAALSSR